MGVFADTVKESATTVYSPDKNIRCVLKGMNSATAKFRPGSFKSYSEIELEHQMLALIKQMVLAREKTRIEALKKATRREHLEPFVPPDAKMRKYYEKHKELTGFGGNDCIKVYSSPGMSWKVKIRPGIIESISEDEFLNKATEAVKVSISDLRSKSIALRAEIVGLTLFTNATTTQRGEGHFRFECRPPSRPTSF